jgi:hypothetical protein
VKEKREDISMSFVDELRILQKNKKSDQEIYVIMMKETYKYLKQRIKEEADKGIREGDGKSFNWITSFSCNHDFVKLVNHLVTEDYEFKEDGDEYIFKWKEFCSFEVKKTFFTYNLKVSLTPLGKKLTQDLQALARMDGITLTFKPDYVNMNNLECRVLDDFDTFYKVNSGSFGSSVVRLNLNIHYVIA